MSDAVPDEQRAALDSLEPEAIHIAIGALAEGRGFSVGGGCTVAEVRLDSGAAAAGVGCVFCDPCFVSDVRLCSAQTGSVTAAGGLCRAAGADALRTAPHRIRTYWSP